MYTVHYFNVKRKTKGSHLLYLDMGQRGDVQKKYIHICLHEPATAALLMLSACSVLNKILY
jgi:hypothetical protein